MRAVGRASGNHSFRPHRLQPMCSKAFSDIDEKHGAESEVLSELLGICTVGLFCSVVGLFHLWRLSTEGRILGLLPSVTGCAESIKKKWGPFVPVFPHGNEHQALGSSLATGCRAGFSCWDASYPWRVILRPHRRHWTFSTASPARNSYDLLIT